MVQCYIRERERKEEKTSRVMKRKRLNERKVEVALNIILVLFRVEVCSLLLAHGADPTLLNCHSKSALDATPTKELQEKLSCEYCT